MAKTQLTLVIPDLARVLQQKINANRLPKSLTTIIAKAQFKADNSKLTRLLFNMFSASLIESKDLPYMQLLDADPTTICATPCYLHADRDRLLLFANEEMLTEKEASDLCNELQQLVDEFNGTLVRHSSGEILLQLAARPNVEFCNVADVTGRSVTNYLPEGEDKAHWIRLWSEIQMKLYESHFNQQRELAGKMPINSLWFWGMGEFNAKQNYWQNVQGNHLILKQLARAASVPETKSLSVERDLQVLDKLNLEADWQQQLEQYDQDIIKPALQQCRKAKINRLELVIPEYGSYLLTPLNSWKFW